jgi:hypothetical protein
VTKKLELEYGNVEIGHPDLGFMPRDERIFTGKGGYDGDDEDKAYEQWLRTKGIRARVSDAVAEVFDD